MSERTRVQHGVGRPPDTGRRLRSLGLLALLALLAFGLSTCDLDELLEDLGITDPCSTASGPSDVAGEWTLTARGSRSGCDEADFDGTFRVPAVGLDVVQSPTEDDPNVDELALRTPISPAGVTFSFRGTVRGTCVDFTTEEDGSTGFFRFVFDGNLDGPDVAGQFSGDGPPGCVSTGDFRVTVR